MVAAEVMKILNEIIEHQSEEWDPMSENDEVLRVELPSTSDEYKGIKQKVPFAITKIERIQNKFLMARYILKKQGYSIRPYTIEERLLFHGTHLDNVDNICLNNFDWRKVCDHNFGKGVSFSPSPCYALRFSIGDTRVILAVKVLLGKACQGHYDMILPGDDFDTSVNSAETVQVKYFDDEIYPAYLIYYRDEGYDEVLKTLNEIIESECQKWDPMSENDEVLRVELPSTSDEYKGIKQKVPFSITKIERIQNKFLMARYIMKKQEYSIRPYTIEERLLFHGTHLENVDNICLNNFDWRKVCDHNFGKGVSYSPSSCYALRFSIGDTRVILAVKVLLGKACQGHYDMILPGDDFDTSVNSAETVQVKYFDDEIYPAYLIYYRDEGYDEVMKTLNEIIESECQKWDPMSENDEVLRVELPSTSGEYIAIKQRFRFMTTKIERIQNKFLMARYTLKKQEYLTRSYIVEERLLFHGTHLDNVDNICLNNFDWRKICAHKFGHGVSFSPCSWYAHHYSRSYPKVMLLVKVLFGRAILGDYNMILPGDYFDTSVNSAATVQVKYFDDEFYPAYLIYF